MFLYKKNIVKRFQKDNSLLYAVHDFKEKDENRNKYISDFRNSTDFTQMEKTNSLRFRDPFFYVIKSFSARNYLFVLLLCLVTAGFTIVAVVADENKKNNKLEFKTQTVTGNILLITVSVMVVLVIGTINEVIAKRVEKNEKIEEFYHRTIIRLYNKIVKLYPNLQSNNVQDYCPEMLRVISNLLIANMSKADTDKMVKMALSVADLSNLYDDKDVVVMKDIERKIKSAIQIVEKCLYENPDLYRVVVDAYSGKIPTTFVLNQNQNVK